MKKMRCHECSGKGEVLDQDVLPGGGPITAKCPLCGGKGEVSEEDVNRHLRLADEEERKKFEKTQKKVYNLRNF